MHALKAHPCFAGARIVLVPEANLGNEAQIVSDLLLARMPVEIVCQFRHAYGVWTSPTIPQAYVLRAIRRLDDGSIFFHHDLVSANPWQATLTAAERSRRAYDAFVKQLRAFERTPIRNKSLTRITRYAYSGKSNRAGELDGTKTDDLCMSWLLGTYWSAMAEIEHGIDRVRGASSRLLVPEAMASAPEPMRLDDDRAFASAALGDVDTDAVGDGAESRAKRRRLE